MAKRQTSVDLSQIPDTEEQTQNEVLRLKFKQLHNKIVDVIDERRVKVFLFEKGVIRMDDLEERGSKKVQRRELLRFLDKSEHPEAFLHLYDAMKLEANLQGLVKEIEEMNTPPREVVHRNFDIRRISVSSTDEPYLPVNK